MNKITVNYIILMLQFTLLVTYSTDKNPCWLLTGLKLVKTFRTFYGTRRYITAFTSAPQLSLSWTSTILFIHPHPTSWRSILILSSHLCHNNWVPVTTAWRVLGLGREEWTPIWMVGSNIMNMWLRTADKNFSSNLGVGQGDKIFSS